MQENQKENINPAGPFEDGVLKLRKHSSEPLSRESIPVKYANPRYKEVCVQDFIKGDEDDKQKSGDEKSKNGNQADDDINRERKESKEENQKRMQDSIQLQESYKLDKNSVFEDKIKKNVITFSKDKYNHFIILKILENKEENECHIFQIIELVLQSLKELSEDKFGYKIVQQSLEVAKDFHQQQSYDSYYRKFVDFIVGNTLNYALPMHQYGNYVSSKAIELFEGDDLKAILNCLNKNIISEENNDLCSNQYGCLMIQKLIECYKNYKSSLGEISRILKEIMDKIYSNSIRLSQQQFSNYVIQQMIWKGDEEYSQKIINNIIQNYFYILSKDKYGSNVVEKVIEMCTLGDIETICNGLFNNIKDKDKFENMLNDKFGNYVLSTLYKKGENKIQKLLYNSTNALYNSNKLNEYGQHVLQKMKQYFDQKKMNNYKMVYYPYYDQQMIMAQQQQQQELYQQQMFQQQFQQQQYRRKTSQNLNNNNRRKNVSGVNNINNSNNMSGSSSNNSPNNNNNNSNNNNHVKNFNHHNYSNNRKYYNNNNNTNNINGNMSHNNNNQKQKPQYQQYKNHQKYHQQQQVPQQQQQVQLLEPLQNSNLINNVNGNCNNNMRLFEDLNIK